MLVETVSPQQSRRGAVLVLAALVMVMVFAFAAFSADVGYMALVKQELQNAADAAALGSARELGNLPADVRLAAKEIALENTAAQQPVVLEDTDIELGVYDIVTRSFVVDEAAPNAVRVTARTFDRPLFFAPVIQHDDFDMSASAIAMLNPRDIVIAVDLSGSMNDDTEPCWAAQTVNDTYAGKGFPTIGNQLMQNVYSDFGFGTYPGDYEHIGESLGMPLDNYAFAEMTKDDGPLSGLGIPVDQRIAATDDEYVRKEKAYKWIIANQVLKLMPSVKPNPAVPTNYAYWEKYLDYVVDGAWVGDPPPPPPDPDDGGDDGDDDSTPPPPPPPPPPSPPIGMIDRLMIPHGWELSSRRPARVLGQVASSTLASTYGLLAEAAPTFSDPGMPRRGSNEYIWVPWGADEDKIWHFNNPNTYTFPAPSDWGWNWRNKVGYVTYVQYLMDWGRDRSPLHGNDINASSAALPKLDLSLQSSDCPLHNEDVAGKTYQFPPREQPMHAVRRALISAITEIETRNGNIQPGAGDNVAIVTFDALDADHTPQLVVSLTSDYDVARLACTTLQSVSDIGSSTATEAGLIVARDHVRDAIDGGAGRPFADDVIVLITDGVPNAIQSDVATVDSYLNNNASPEWYSPSYWWYNAPMMQTQQMEEDDVYLYAVGMGLGTDYDFMDRLARLGRTDKNGLSPRGSGNPADYEQVLIDVINEIIRNPGTRIVE